MRDLVFSDADEKRRLENLLHPLIRAESERQIATALAKSATPYVIHVVPLLVESAGHRGRVSRVLVVDCPESLQVHRVRQRSGLPEAEVRRIMATQVQRERRLAAADDVIDNSGTIAAMQQQVLALHDKYLALHRAR
jgi:dephospho-CoA kinase